MDVGTYNYKSRFLLTDLVVLIFTQYHLTPSPMMVLRVLQWHSQPHIPWWAIVSLSSFFPNFHHSAFFSPQNFLIYILMLALWVSELPTWESPGYAIGVLRKKIFLGQISPPPILYSHTYNLFFTVTLTICSYMSPIFLIRKSIAVLKQHLGYIRGV